MNFRLTGLALIILTLAGCATPPVAPSPAAKPASPKPADTQASANWVNLGVTQNGNVLNEIDRLSISRQGNLVNFRDRKTIFDLNKENFLNTPRHKISLNNWQIDCSTKTFRLLSMTLLDENGREIARISYNDKQIKPMAIPQNSASYQQMLFVCPKGQGN